MSIKQPIYHEFDLNATSGNSRVISLTHTDDAHVDVIELCVKQQGAPVDIAGATVVARMVLHSTADILLNDSVPCTINDAGNILIPFDNAAVQTRKGIVKIEVNITRTPDILTLQLPLWVKINGSILDDATVDPHSEGTIPELLKDAADALEEATQALEDAKDYDNLENKPQINSHTLSGNKSSDDLGLQKKLTAGQNITLESDGTISASGGVTSYEDLTNKPQIVVRNSPTGWSQTLTFNGKFRIIPFYFSNGQAPNGQDEIILNIKDNAITFNMLENNDKIFYNYGNYSNPPSDLFTNYYTAPYENGIWYIPMSASALQGLPVAKPGAFINYYAGYTKFQLYITWVDDSTIGHSQVFFRVSYMANLGTWQEITNQNVVSGVVNSDGTITFSNSDGTTFTTTGASVIGADGFSPTATVTQTASGATVSITDSTGTTTANISNGADGSDYVLTAQDKSDIADIVLSELPTTQGVLYGNTSN